VSDVDSENLWTAAGANPVDMKAALWLARRDRGDWSQSDQAEFDAWLSASAAHTITFLRLYDAWNRADRLAALRAPASEQLSNISRGRIGKIVARVMVSCIVIAAMAAAGALYWLAPRETTYATPVGGREVIALSDGSQVELNTDTVLRVSADQEHRTVTLDKGEAYFQIRHDARHPFVVNAFGHRVTDIGTRFVVRADAGRIEVALVEGRARIDSADGALAHSAVLTPGDTAIATSSTMSITKKPEASLADQLAWRQGLLIFNSTTLADVAIEFNRYNSKKLVIADPVAARLAIMGKFPVNDVELFGRVAKAVLGVRVVSRDNEVVISR
jgi:transmembrane sensor